VHTVMKVTAADTSGVSVSIEETFTKSKNILLSAVKHQMEPTDFRPIKGNQCVGNAYTLASIYPSPVYNNSVSQQAIPDSYIAEIGIRDGPLRVRCRYSYTRGPSAATTPPHGFDLSFASLLVIREFIDTTPAMDTLPLLDSTLGAGIYDPQGGGPTYCNIDLPGKISLLFPRGLISPILPASPSMVTSSSASTRPKRNTFCLLWEGRRLRYQADRLFTQLDGSLKSFELTEILPADAATYKIEKPPPPPILD